MSGFRLLLPKARHHMTPARFGTLRRINDMIDAAFSAADSRKV
jgi:hypothetical protein